MTAAEDRIEARKCVDIARKALAQGDLAKAQRFADKAFARHRCEETEQLLTEVRLAASGDAAGESPRAANGHHHHQSPPPEPRAPREEPCTASSSRPAGMGTSGLHHRRTHHHDAAPPPPPVEDPGTAEQRKQVADILAAKDLYEILGLARSATDEDIRKAYRKLALKLHPDKNRAHRADEAFKAVGKAFACLSDPDKRAYYDRTGYESTAAAQAAQQQAAARQGSGGFARGPGGVYYTQDFDPAEIFEMFFGGGMHPQARMFRAQFGGGGGGPRHHAQQQQQHHQQRGGGGGGGGGGGSQRRAEGDDMQRLVFNLFQFLPVILLVLISMFAASQKAPYALMRDLHHYPDQLRTQRLEVAFYVKSQLEFDRNYPRGSSSRFKLERQIESEYYEKQQQRCQTEKLAKHRMWAYGNRDEANRMPMAGCDEVDRMNSKLGLRATHAWG